jgi:hypothetical protein
MPIPITAIVSSLLALMLVGISVRVSVLRGRKKVEFSDGGDVELGRAIRVQGNFIEYVPLTLALMGLMEWMGLAHWFVYTFGAVLVVARLAHAWGLYASAFPGRAAGTAANWLLLAVGALLVIGRVA